MTESSVRTPNPWWIGVVSGMASYIDSAAIVSTSTALVIYQESFGVTDTEIGVMSSALTFCIAIGALFGGRLGDRFGRRRVFLVTMMLVAIGACFLAFSTAFPLLFAGIVLMGLGTGADLPVSLATISEAATDKNRGALLGFSNILWTVGIISVQAIAAVTGDWGRIGGQILFIQVGVVALLLLVGRLSIPESASWTQAEFERSTGVLTIRADKSRVRDLLKRPYLKPFVALLLFYALTNVAANTNGQFGTYVAVNVAGISVSTNSLLNLLGIPIGIIAGLVFMKIVGGRLRMPFFVLGGVCLVVGYALPAVVGFTIVTIFLMSLLTGIGGAFAFEGILKVWSQESFPTLLRSSAQGTIIAVARVVAALVALVTPVLVKASPQGMYGTLAAVVLVGLVIGWTTFHASRTTQFDVEAQLDPDAAPGATAAR